MDEITMDVIKKAQNGNEQAFKEIYNATSGNLYLKASEYFQEKADIEDALQESYIKIYKSLGSLKNTDNFAAWTRTITAHTCIDMVRKRKRHDELLKPETADGDYEGMEDIPVSEIRREFNPADKVDGDENARLISMILDGIPEGQRAALILWGEGKTYTEIGEALGIPDGTAESRVCNGRKKVREKTVQLEKAQKIALHGLTPIAFFVFLVASADKNTVSAETFGNAGALFGQIWSAVSTGTKAAGGAVLKAAGTFFKGSVARKAVAAVIVFTAGAAIIATAALYKPDNAKAGAQPSKTIEAEKEPEKEPEKSDTKAPIAKKEDKTEKDNDDKKDTETSATTSSSEEKQEKDKSDAKTGEEAKAEEYDDKDKTESEPSSEKTASETKDASTTKSTFGSRNSNSGSSSVPSSSGNKNTGNSSGSASSTPAHQHNWVPQYKTVHHDAVTHQEDQGHYENQLVQAAYDDPGTVIYYGVCVCGYKTTNPAELDAHMQATGHNSSGVVPETVPGAHHDAVYKQVWIPNVVTVTDKAAYDENVLTGYVCSGCGATKVA